MRRPRVLLIAALLFLSWAGSLPAAQAATAADRDAAAIARARALVESWVAASGGSASQISVSRGGRILWSEAFGYANLELAIPATPKTRFRIGSVSKPLTAAAIGRLVQEGRLDLDAPVQRYVADFPEKPWPITSRQLAGHLAGIRHYKPGEFVNQRHYDSVRASLAIFENDPLLFEPGTRYAYSSYGWNLLSAVVEGASGEPFLEFMQKSVFDPARMADTGADDPGPIVPNRASFYTRDTESGPIKNALYVDNSIKWAGGGFLSTTDDLLRFANGLMTGTLLKPETVTLLWTSQKTADGKQTGYGIGFDNAPDGAGRRRVFHSGSAQGGTAILILYPDERLAIAMAGNTDFAFTGRARELVRLFLEGEDLGRWESREAGFAMTVPSAWAARVRASYVTDKEAQALHPKAIGAVPFRYTQYGDVNAPPILTILVFPSAEWRAMTKTKTTPPGGEVLANRAGRTWVAVPLEKNPYVPGSSDFEAFEEIRVDAATVRKAFALRPGS